MSPKEQAAVGVDTRVPAAHTNEISVVGQDQNEIPQRQNEKDRHKSGEPQNRHVLDERDGGHGTPASGEGFAGDAVSAGVDPQKDVLEETKPQDPPAPKTAKKTSTKKTAGKKKKSTPRKTKTLVIVESPGKIKNIKKYLGAGYEVVASVGHIRDLPKSRLGILVEEDFTPEYINIRKQSKTIKALKEEAKTAKMIYLATDPDREGEAIAWHLATLLGLDETAPNRVTFNEITEAGVRTGMEHPRTIDRDLVDAQQARRLVDRLVGYKISPLLWKKIRSGLSAGRVQSVVVGMIVDREQEIRAFVPQEYWSIEANLTTLTDQGKKVKEEYRTFTAKFHGKQGEKIELSDQETTQHILDELEHATFQVASIKRGKRKKSPVPPFITSTMQQEASRKLGFQARRTMQVAQTLYEGMEIDGFGSMGLITYMRTDSLRISDEAKLAVKDYIKEQYGDPYHQERKFKEKAGEQGGHEAIRPTLVSLTPNLVRDSLTPDQFKLYRLIWQRFVASQMADCILNTVQVGIEANGYQFRASGYTVEFDGFTVLYEEGDDKKKEEGRLPHLQEQEQLQKNQVEGKQHFTQPPPRYTEASLTKAMEENGIGRPSTYAPTITTILSRGYVEREGKQLAPLPLGEITTDLMRQHFFRIIEVGFTAAMEESLDKVEAGEQPWKQILRDFYGDFSVALEQAEHNIGDEKIILPDEVTDEICDLCGQNMVVKMGRFGKFLACPSYPECVFTKKLVKEMPGSCPKCGGKILEQKSKKGKKFYGCGNYPTCTYLTWDAPTRDLCPKCGKTVLKKAGRNPKYHCSNEECDYEKIEA